MNGKKAKQIRRMVWQGAERFGVAFGMKTYSELDVETRTLFYRHKANSNFVIDAATYYALKRINPNLLNKSETTRFDFEAVPLVKPRVCDRFNQSYRQTKKLYTRHEFEL